VQEPLGCSSGPVFSRRATQLGAGTVGRLADAAPESVGQDPAPRDPTTADRVVQAALKLVLEPIFEADFQPSSYGFRPRRRAQDAIAEIHHLASPARTYEWVFEAGIAACFDEINHAALMARMSGRVSGKRVLASPSTTRASW
jgi:RNA-directed DNA polymerase